MSYTAQELRQAADAKELIDAGKGDQVEQRCEGGLPVLSMWHPFIDYFELSRSDESTRWLYRPKPQPKYVPWTRDELPPLPFEVRGAAATRYCVVMAEEEAAWLGVINQAITYADLLKCYTLADGSPCGKEMP